MQSLTRLIASVALAAAPATWCHAQTRAPRGGAQQSADVGVLLERWEEFSSKAGRFSVLLPGTPKEHVRPVGAGAIKGNTHIFELQLSALYLVLYTDVPATAVEGPALLKAVLDTSRDIIFKQYGTRILEEKEITLGEFPGRYVKMEARAEVVIRMKTYVARNRVYSLILFKKEARAPSGLVRASDFDEAAAKFLDSFKLLPDATGAPPE